MRSFSHIVSLGYRCRTTRRLRDYFGFSTAFVFDWWITPAAGGARFLREWDLERLYHPSRLREVRRRGRLAYVENVDYGIRLQHDFPTDDAREYVLPGWRAALPAAKARMGHLMRKFELLSKPHRPALFVRELMAQEEGDTAAVADLRAAVLERLPRAPATFLLISRSGVEVEGWIPLRIDDPVERPWTGTPALWNAALSSLGFTLDREGAPPPPGRSAPPAGPPPPGSELRRAGNS